MGNCCMTQGTQKGTLWQSRRSGWGGRWEEGLGGRGHGCTYGWFLMFDRKQQNSVKQLSFNWKIYQFSSVQFSSVTQSCPTLRPRESQHARPPCPSPTPGVHSNSCPSSRWCHPAISSSVVPFSSCLQYFPASGSFPMSQFFSSGGQSIGVSASGSVLPVSIQNWFPLGWTGWISLQSQGTLESLLQHHKWLQNWPSLAELEGDRQCVHWDGTELVFEGRKLFAWLKRDCVREGWKS